VVHHGRSATRWKAQVQRAAAMSGDLTKAEDVVPFIVFLATDGAPALAVGAPSKPSHCLRVQWLMARACARPTRYTNGTLACWAACPEL
jgi:hypothetical protein